MAENRFSDLVGGLRQGKGKAEASQPKATSKAKSKSPDHTKVTLYLTKALHKKMRSAAVELELELSEIAERAIDDWLD